MSRFWSEHLLRDDKIVRLVLDCQVRKESKGSRVLRDGLVLVSTRVIEGDLEITIGRLGGVISGGPNEEGDDGDDDSRGCLSSVKL